MRLNGPVAMSPTATTAELLAITLSHIESLSL
jgi:hypothetical protein